MSAQSPQQSTFKAKPAQAAAPSRRLSRRLLRLALHPSLHAFIGADRIEAIGRWIDVNVMFKRRQRRCRAQKPEAPLADYLRAHFCEEPFRTLETSHNGLAFVCCPVWLPTPIGALGPQSAAIWSSPAAKAIRGSIVDGSFSHCDHRNCSRIASRSLMPRTSPDAQAFITAFERGEAPAMPKNIILSHDKSCNLSCPSCRAQTYAANKATQAKLDALTDEAILPLLKEAENVKITGSGDPFGSNHFRNLIKRLTAGDFPHLKIELHTNGQLWDARAWRALGLAGHVNAAHISIDATEPDTYAFARRGGSFERLLANLAFVKELRERGEISHLVFSMVVQTRNFREMPAFVALGQRFKADLVSFQMIRQRDIFSREEHDEAFIGNPQHRDYAEFVEVLKDPVLDSSYVEIGNVRAYARAV